MLVARQTSKAPRLWTLDASSGASRPKARMGSGGIYTTMHATYASILMRVMVA